MYQGFHQNIKQSSTAELDASTVFNIDNRSKGQSDLTYEIRCEVSSFTGCLNGSFVKNEDRFRKEIEGS